ncbi:hypothetical protein KSP39_PZI001009 [Platanthera zijinensis]|uniref:Uncharacterized protein n=1 Tax=Platanthera zijinensis TaxID=2320716 RepID=A0AAP0C4H7_9ASPA
MNRSPRGDLDVKLPGIPWGSVINHSENRNYVIGGPFGDAESRTIWQDYTIGRADEELAQVESIMGTVHALHLRMTNVVNNTKLTVGIKVVFWQRKGRSWVMAWKSVADVLQVMVFATWSSEGLVATSACCLLTSKVDEIYSEVDDFCQFQFDDFFSTKGGFVPSTCNPHYKSLAEAKLKLSITVTVTEPRAPKLDWPISTDSVLC